MSTLRDSLLQKQANYRQTATQLGIREMQLKKQLRETREARAGALQASQVIDETLADLAAAHARAVASTPPAAPPQG